jgi:tetratricopeptide (TPR) repeat protein
MVATHQIDEKTQQRIESLCAEGDRLTESGDDNAALRKYYAAWELVPADKANWEASTWISGAIGEVYFRHKKFDNALRSFRSAVRSPGGLGNPYIHLRLGQIEFERGNLAAAGDEMTRAYMGAGEDIFANEDKKYLQYLRTVLRPPARR